ncbi:hypothetical protein GQ457_01G001200 [Hibiscus cannabinus]
MGKAVKLTEQRLKRITGHVNDEALRRLERYVIGSTSTVCTSESVKDRLHNWGLGELLVKSLGGKKFLIEFHDEELFNLLKEKNWTILEEIFLEVEIWTETFRVAERITWLEIIGLPLHCWNQETCRRIASIWGSLEALGENATQCLDCEKLTILISKNQIHKIDEVIDLEVGRDVFAIRVLEPTIMERTIIKHQSSTPFRELSLSESSSEEVSRQPSHLSPVEDS